MIKKWIEKEQEKNRLRFFTYSVYGICLFLFFGFLLSVVGLFISSNGNPNEMFENVTKKYDVIVSNPPYIKTTEEIENIVKDNEPHLALYAGEDGLDYYKKILKNAESHMKDRCIIAFEIGMTQAEDITKLAYENLSDIRVEIKKDLSEKDRMLFIFKNI